MRSWRHAILADADAARRGDLARHLRSRQHAAVSRLGALRQLNLDHLHLRIVRLFGEFVRIEMTVRSAAAEVAAADFPDQVAAVLAVVAADRTLAGVVREAAELGAEIQ